MSLEKVPCTIVTGFLGAGKTTLVRHLLENVRGRRLAVIVNEFGDVGVDGEILKSCGIESCPEENIVELANGCICCTVADDFVPTLESLLGRKDPPEHILIETSGLALPKPLVKAFEWPAIRSRVTVDAVVAVVDGRAVADGRFADDPEALQRQREADPNLDHDNPLEEVFEDQILCADLVILNKGDLMDEDARNKAHAQIKAALRPCVRVVETAQGRIDPAVLIGLGSAAEDDLASRRSHHDGEEEHDHDDFETFIVDVPAFADAGAFAKRLSGLAEQHDVLRMKGYMRVAGKPMRLLVQAVGPRVQHQFDRPWGSGETGPGRLVVIGEKGLDRAAIEAALKG
jgi:cobalamin biosynthesis protein CobW